MKILLSISLTLLILFSGISIKIATHFCEGTIAARKISLSGELASCGMEQNTNNNPFQYSFDKECCKDILSVYSLSDNYLPSTFTINDPAQQVNLIINVPLEYQVISSAFFSDYNLNTRPPGAYFPNSVKLSSLSVFRI